MWLLLFVKCFCGGRKSKTPQGCKKGEPKRIIEEPTPAPGVDFFELSVLRRGSSAVGQSHPPWVKVKSQTAQRQGKMTRFSTHFSEMMTAQAHFYSLRLFIG